ncbi:hypothetical protein OXIME_000298 [Oxyplasma meridianum]|uniref:Transposase IS4-like domain-containing protein n=1 Tax=Oxyplasma meridianum TaxID=3073602 RepID=A0AAX4NE34_9ARCH
MKDSNETDQQKEKQSEKELKDARKLDQKEKKKAMEHERNNANTRRSKGRSWTAKNKRLHFRYKLHTIQDAHNDMIINYSTIKA